MKSSHYLLLFILLMLLAGLMSCNSSKTRTYRVRALTRSHFSMEYIDPVIVVEEHSTGYHIGDTVTMNINELRVIVDTIK